MQIIERIDQKKQQEEEEMNKNLSQMQESFISKSQRILTNRGFIVKETKLLNRAVLFFIEDSLSKNLVAKVTSLNQFRNDDEEEVIPLILSESLKDANMISKLKHQNVVQYISHFQEGSSFFVIIERALMNLNDFIKLNFNKISITEEQFFCFACQLINGVSFLHKKGIIIRDFKPTDILVFPSNKLKLSGFGLSKRFPPLFSHENVEQYSRSQFQGNFMYFPPEIIEMINQQEQKVQQSRYQSIKQIMQQNIWSLGLSLLTLLKVKPYTLIALSCGYYQFQDLPNVTPKMNQLLKYLLEKDPQSRPTFKILRQKLCDLLPLYKSNFLIQKAILARDKYLNFDKAEELLREAIQEDPTNSRAYSNLALSFYRRDDPEFDLKVSKIIEKSLELDPNNEEAVILSSWDHITNEQQEKEELMQKALSINDQNPFVLNWIGLRFFQKDDLDTAENYFRKAIEVDENFGKAYSFLGDLFRQKKQFEEALEWYQKGMGKDYADIQLLVQMGQIFIYDLRKDSLGKKCLQIAVQQYPNCAQSKYLCGLVFLDNKNYNKALPYFEEIVKQEPQNQKFRLKLAKTLYFLQRYNEGEEHIKYSVSISINRDNLLFLGCLTGELGKQEECIQAFEKVIVQYPNDSVLHGCFAEYLEQFGLLHQALEEYEKSERIEHDELNTKSIQNIRKKLNIK